MSRRSRVSWLRTHSPTTFPEGTGIQKTQTDPITRIQMNGRRPDQSISLVLFTVHQVWDPWRIDGGIVTILLHSQFRYSFPLYFTYGYLFLSCLSLLLTHTCALTHALTHALIQALTHALIHVLTHALIHALTHALTHVHFCLLRRLLMRSLCLLIHSSCTVYKDKVDTTIL
jgi:hypothetical protein